MDISSKIRFLTMVPVTLNAPGLPPKYKVARVSACISRTYKINYLRRVFLLLFYFTPSNGGQKSYNSGTLVAGFLFCSEACIESHSTVSCAERSGSCILIT